LEAIKITVIIPVKNGAATLEKCLHSIAAQTVAANTEIIVLDSMSTDSSRTIALKYGTKIIDIPERSFDHGLTRNIGVQHAAGSLIFFTVQDAWMAENNMLEKMAAHFKDSAIMGVVGHQAVPHEKDKNPLVWYRPCSPAVITIKQVQHKTAFDQLSAGEQQSMMAWDDVVAMYRKDGLIQQPFVKTAFAEDWIWSYQALLKGWKLVHDSSLIVYHYHHQAYHYAFRLIYTVNYHFYKFFKFKPSLPAVVIPTVEAVYHLLKNNNISFKEKIYWIRHNCAAMLAAFFSTANFLVRFKLHGEAGIEHGFLKYCSNIPQGKQHDLL
jgi:rhamnosyltransferase